MRGTRAIARAEGNLFGNTMGMVALVSLARTGASNGLHAMASQNPSFEQGTSHSTPGIV